MYCMDAQQDETGRITNGLTKSLAVLPLILLKGQCSDTKFMQLLFLF